MPKPKTYPKLRGVFERPIGSDIWWISYQQGSVRKREKVGTRGNAISKYHERKKEIRDGKQLDTANLRHKGAKFNVLAEDAVTWTLNNKPKHIRHVQSRMKSINAEFGERVAAEIEAADIERWLNGQTHWAPATKNRHRALMSLVYRLAIKAKKMKSNPASLTEMQPERNERPRFLSPEEETALMAVLRKDYPENIPAFIVSIHTGMRLSEQFGLLWRQVDLVGKVVRLDQTKNGDLRNVHLNKTALAAFEGLAKTPHKPSDTVWDSKSIKWFTSAIEKAGIDNYTWHVNRHTFCSRLAQQGASIFHIAELAGHRDLKMTRRYSHLRPSDSRAAVEMLD